MATPVSLRQAANEGTNETLRKAESEPRETVSAVNQQCSSAVTFHQVPDDLFPFINK